MSSSQQNNVPIPQMNPSSQQMSSSWGPGNVSSYQMNIPSRLMNPTSYQISTGRQSMNSSGTPVNSSSQQVNLSSSQINVVPQQKNSSEAPREISSQQLFLNQSNPATQQMSSSWAPMNPFSSQTNTSSGHVNLASNKIDTSSFHLNKKINSADNIKHIVDPAHPKHYSQFQYNKPKQVLNPKTANETIQMLPPTPDILNRNIETTKTRKNTESSKPEQLQMPKAEQSQTLDDKTSSSSMKTNVVSQNALQNESFSPERKKKLESKSSSQSPTKKIASAFSRLGHDFIHGLQNRNQESTDAFVPGKHKKSNFSKKD